MIIKTEKPIPASEITDPLVFQQRRKIIKTMLAGMLLPSSLASVSANPAKPRWPELVGSPLSGDYGPETPAKLSKNYTNYYEFSFNKEDSTELAQNLRTDGWELEITGEVEKPGIYQPANPARIHLSLSLCGRLVHGGAVGGIRTGGSDQIG